MESIIEGKNATCRFLLGIGVNCDATVISVWQLILGFVVFCVIAGMVAYIRSFRQLEDRQRVVNMKIPYGGMKESHMIRLNAKRMAELLDEPFDAEEGIKAISEKLRKKYKDKFFVVDFRENGKTILKKELNLDAGWQRIAPQEFKLDHVSLAELKKSSRSAEDDDSDNTVGAVGEFDIYVRPVMPLDVRHWINHPQREVRYGVLMGIFATLIEYSSNLFGLARALL
jgi:hypothetical protein